jgi:hypothetical protein
MTSLYPIIRWSNIFLQSLQCLDEPIILNIGNDLLEPHLGQIGFSV